MPLPTKRRERAGILQMRFDSGKFGPIYGALRHEFFSTATSFAADASFSDFGRHTQRSDP
jgi:hypothetical protein